MKKIVLFLICLGSLLQLQGCAVYPPYGARVGVGYGYPSYGYQPNYYQPYGRFGWGGHHGWRGGGHGWHGGGHGWGGGHHGHH